MREFSNFNYEAFIIHHYIKNKDFKNAAKLEHNFIQRFFTEIYKHYFNSDEVVTLANLNNFIEQICTDSKISFTKKEMYTYIEQFRTINFDDQDIELKSKELSRRLFVFISKLYSYIYKEIEEDYNE